MRAVSGALLASLAGLISINTEREYRADDNETMVVVRQLESIQNDLWSVEYPVPKVLTFVPRDTTVAPGATHFTWRIWDVVGMADFVVNYGKDLPRVDALVSETTQKIQPIGDAFAYTHEDLRMAAQGQIQLDSTKARAAKDAIDRKLDSVLSLGHVPTGITGFANNANVPRLTVTNGAWLTTNIANPDKLLADLNQMEATIITQSYDNHAPDTLILPLRHYALIATLPRSANSDTTVLDFFLKNSRNIKRVESWYRLATSGPLSAPMAIMYKNDPMVLRAIVPVAFEQLTPEVRNLEWLVNCLARVGGTVVYKPLAMLYGDGI